MLRQGLEQQLRLLGARCFSSTAISSQAPALATAIKSKGLLGSLFGGSSRVTTPLTDPLPGVPDLVHEAPASAPATETTTLANGVRIASENTPVRRGSKPSLGQG